MSKISIQFHKEIPLKIYRETFKTDKNIINLGKLKANRVSDLSKESDVDFQNNVKDSKSTDKINKSRFLTEKNIKRLTTKELYRFNSFNALTDTNIQNNFRKHKSQNNSKQILKLVIANNDSKKKLSMQRRLKKLKLNKMFNKNLISFDERIRIKKFSSVTSLKLYELYLQRKSQKLSIDDINPFNRTFSNQYFDDVKNKLFINYNNKRKNNNNYSAENSFSNYSINSSQSNKKLDKTKRNYSLNQLMEMNPYRLVSDKVKYSNPLIMKQISQKLMELNSDGINDKVSYTPAFFKNSIMKNNKMEKMINGCFVQFNDNIFYESDLIWRILSMIKKAHGFSSFYSACQFKGYSELWKNYTILIEQLLAKYPLFKWFFEKNKYYLKEAVLNEFISCLKIGMTFDDKDFSSKLILLFGDNGFIDIKLFFLIMELISNSSDIFEKIKFIVELLSDSKLKKEGNSINIAETFILLKNIFNSSNYRKDIKYFLEILKKTFNDGKKFDNNLYSSKAKLINLLLKNAFIQRKIREFIIRYEKADIIFDEQISHHFNSNEKMINEFLYDK